MSKGSLIVVGTGIQIGGHITAETEAHIRHADKVYFVVIHKLTADWIRSMNQSAESLAPLYRQHELRVDAYRAMAHTILATVRTGQRVCAVFYGHPGVFVAPSRWVIRWARQEGFAARMLPGISAEDCLFADLGIDPVTHGCQSFEATDFLIRRRRFDPHSMLILWQIGGLGNVRAARKVQPKHLRVLVDELTNYYPANQPAIVYEASRLPTKPSIQQITLAQLPQAAYTPLSTLVVQPLPQPPLDTEFLRRLDLSAQDLQSSRPKS